jgi:hypothetical protein
MKIAKICTLLLCFALLAGTFTACGNNDGAGTPTPLPSADALPENFTGIDFSNGNIDFLMLHYKPFDASPGARLELAEFGGVNAAKITPDGDFVPYVAIDASSLLGERVTEVYAIEAVMAVENPGGTFQAVSGEILAYSGTGRAESKESWSVYLENRNPNIARMELKTPGQRFVPDSYNFFIINRKVDNAVSAGSTAGNLYILRIGFLDEAGNYLPVDDSAKFNEPAGFNESLFSDYELPEMNLRNSNFHQGWLTDGVDGKDSPYLVEDVSRAQKLVLEFTNPPTAGMQIVWQGDGDNWTWHEKNLDEGEVAALIDGNALTFSLPAHLINYEAFTVSTQLKLILGYESVDEETGDKSFIESLGITRAYLVLAE